MVAISEKDANNDSRSCLGTRHIQTFLMFLATVLCLCMRVNMSLAIVDMTDSSKDNSFEWSVKTQSVILSSFFWGYVVLQVPGGMMAGRLGCKWPMLCLVSSFEWSVKTQSVILSSFFWGYVVLQVPGGMMAGRLGCKWPMLCLVSVNSLLCFVTPAAAYYGGWLLVCACRVLQGLVQGMLYPCLHCFIAKWVPVEEKSRLGTFIYAGGQLGTALQSIYAGFLAARLGWEYIFYLNGVLGTTWSVIYIIIGASSPQECNNISDEERNYILKSLGTSADTKKLSVPWKALFTSLPFLALIVTNVGQNWGFWTLLTLMPSYMKQILNVDIKTNGVVSAVPYLVMYFMSFPLGFISDYVIRKQWVSVTTSRKISNTIGFWGAALALVALSYAPAGNLVAGVALLSLVVGINAGYFTGYALVHIDMSPNFAGVMVGITNGIAGVGAIVAPLVAGLLLVDETSADDWRKVFYLAAFIFFITNLTFLIFASSKQQPFNNPDKIFEEKKKQEA